MTEHPSSLTFAMTAHHEAGHAVMAVMLDRPFEAVEVSADGSGEFFPEDEALYMNCETYLHLGTPDLERLNILYGRNYSGKTTLSRILRSLQEYSLPEHHEGCCFTTPFSRQQLR